LPAADGSILATGGRGKVLRLFKSETFDQIEEIPIDGRIWGIDFSRHTAASNSNPKSEGDPSYSYQMAVASGSDVAIIFDAAFLPCLHVPRPRTVRGLVFHPRLPILAIGDGSGYVAIVDYDQEETLKEFNAGSRINTVAFSPTGDFLCIGTDECLFALYETNVSSPCKSGIFFSVVSF